MPSVCCCRRWVPWLGHVGGLALLVSTWGCKSAAPLPATATSPPSRNPVTSETAARTLRVLLDDGRPVARKTLRLRCGEEISSQKTTERGELRLPDEGPCQVWLGKHWPDEWLYVPGSGAIKLPPELRITLGWRRIMAKGALVLDSRVDDAHPQKLFEYRLRLQGESLWHGESRVFRVEVGKVLPFSVPRTPTHLLPKPPPQVLASIVDQGAAQRFGQLRAAWLRAYLAQTIEKVFPVRARGKTYALLKKALRAPPKQAKKLLERALERVEKEPQRSAKDPRRRRAVQAAYASFRLGQRLQACQGWKTSPHNWCSTRWWLTDDVRRSDPQFMAWVDIESLGADLARYWALRIEQRSMLMYRGERSVRRNIRFAGLFNLVYVRRLRRLARKWRRDVVKLRRWYKDTLSAKLLAHADARGKALTKTSAPDDLPTLRVVKVERLAALPIALRGPARGEEAAKLPVRSSIGLSKLSLLLGRRRTLVLLTSCPDDRRWVAPWVAMSQRYGWMGLKVGALMLTSCKSKQRHQAARGLWRAGPTMAWALGVQPPAAVLLDGRGAVLWRQQLRSLREGVDAATAWMEQNWTSFAAARKSGPPAPASALVKKLTRLESAARALILAKRGSKALALAKKALMLAPDRSEVQRLVALAAGHARDVGEVVARSSWWRRRYGDLAAEALLDDVRKETGVPKLDDPGRRTP